MAKDYNGIKLHNGDVVIVEANVQWSYDEGKVILKIENGPSISCDSKLCRLKPAKSTMVSPPPNDEKTLGDDGGREAGKPDTTSNTKPNAMKQPPPSTPQQVNQGIPQSRK